MLVVKWGGKMHKGLKEMLNRVHGESQHVIAISIDVRDFSRFSQSQDSVDVALFISKFYLQLIERYQAVIEDFFFKPTGDGLMICIPYDEDTLKDRFSKVIQISLDCHQDFRTMFDDLNVINFETPSLLGIGIARGSACAIVANDDDSQYTIDYSGHKLNLAARLQDLQALFLEIFMISIYFQKKYKTDLRTVKFTFGLLLRMTL